MKLIPNYKLKKTEKNQGFTLVEALVAVYLLTMGIMGPLFLASKNIGIARTSQNESNAYFLAQEGLEMVKNRKDLNIKSGQSWLNNLGNCIGGKKCYIDASAIGFTPTECNGGVCPKMKYGNNTGRYNYLPASSSNVETVFIRAIEVSEIQPDIEINAKVTVSWTDQYGSKSIFIEDNLFNFSW